ncbi:hypothetical protein [Paraflavitalea speifideaquila]|uniref:hypothetical protein n=1 Tax=Paraflavitalea speifideaquila TaxID=3076558 RepID=UPI0028ED912E|nr:hypothetical protein [Paraflavitalea speifideiaquila]
MRAILFYLNINFPRMRQATEKNYSKPQVVEAMIQLKRRRWKNPKTPPGIITNWPMLTTT